MQISISLAYLEQWDIVSDFFINTYRAIRDFIVFVIVNFALIWKWFWGWVDMSVGIIGGKFLELINWWIHKDDYKN